MENSKAIAAVSQRQLEFDTALIDLRDYKDELQAAKELQANSAELWVITLEISRIKNKLRSLAPSLAIDPRTIT